VPIVAEEQPGTELDAMADLVDPAKNLVPELGIVGLDITKAVHELLPDLRRPAGVVVAARQANTPYSGPALETGDAIYAVNHRVIGGVEQLRDTLGAMKSGQPAVLTVEREGHILYVPIELD
jgi:serine protease Do